MKAISPKPAGTVVTHVLVVVLNMVVAVVALQLNVTSEFGGASEKALLWTVWPERSMVSPAEGTGEVSFIPLLNQR
jgi:hypothetical protein